MSILKDSLLTSELSLRPRARFDSLANVFRTENCTFVNRMAERHPNTATLLNLELSYLQGTHISSSPVPALWELRMLKTLSRPPLASPWAGSPGPQAGFRSISWSPPFALEKAVPPFGPQGSLGQSAPRSAESGLDR